MSLGRTIAYNTVLQTASKITTTLLGMVAFSIISRSLGTEQFGAFTTVTAFLQFFGIIADMGLSIIAIQMLAEGGDNDKTFSNIVTIRIVSAITLFGIAPFVALLFPYALDVKIGIALSSVSFLCSSLIQLFTTPYQARIKMLAPSVIDNVARLILIAVLVWTTFSGKGLYGALIAVGISNVFQLVVLAWFSRRLVAFRFSFDLALWSKVMNRTWPIMISIWLNLIYLKTDTIILSLFHSEGDVGIYGAAYRVFEVLFSFPMMFMSIIIGSFAKAWTDKDMVSFRRYFQKSFEVIAIAAIPLVVGAYFVGTRGMIFISGPEFSASGDVLKILMIASCLFFFSNFYANLINMVNAQKKMIVGYAVSALVGLVGYFLFIPSFSYWGAAWMTVLVELIALIFSYTVFTKATSVTPTLGIILRVILASGVMALFLWLVPALSLLLQIPLAAGIYIVALYLVGGLSSELLETLQIRFFSRKLPPILPNP